MERFREAFVTSITCIAPPSRKQTRRCQSPPIALETRGPLRRVAIVGGGIAGLSTAIALERQSSLDLEELTVFERRPGLDTEQGGALNLTGGASVLVKQFDLGHDISTIGNPLRRIRGRTGEAWELYDIRVPQLLARSPRGRQSCFVGDDCIAYTVMRDELQALLRKNLAAQVRVLYGTEVVSVHSDGRVTTRDPSGHVNESQYDLVVGADGIRSNVREWVVEEAFTPRSLGIRVQFAVSTDTSVPDGELHQWFGDGGYALEYSAGTGNSTRGLVILVSGSTSMAMENVNYKATSSRVEFMQRLTDCCLPTRIGAVIEKSDRLIDTAVFDHRVLSRWSRGNVVLVGDAAHAMAPFLGQGANQAIQDASCLASKLSQYDVEEALLRFEQIRRPPTARLMRTSRILGLLETQKGNGRSTRDLLFRVLGEVGVVGSVFASSCLPVV